MVLDVHTGEVLALANWPTYNPNDRTHLTGEQLRNRVITDTFEPGSTLKPFTVSLALDTDRVTPTTLFDTGGGRFVLDGAPITDDTRARRDRRRQHHPEVVQHRHHQDRACSSSPRRCGRCSPSVGFGQAPKLRFPGAAAGRVRP